MTPSVSEEGQVPFNFFQLVMQLMMFDKPVADDPEIEERAEAQNLELVF